MLKSRFNFQFSYTGLIFGLTLTGIIFVLSPQSSYGLNACDPLSSTYCIYFVNPDPGLTNKVYLDHGALIEVVAPGLTSNPTVLVVLCQDPPSCNTQTNPVAVPLQPPPAWLVGPGVVTSPYAYVGYVYFDGTTPNSRYTHTLAPYLNVGSVTSSSTGPTIEALYWYPGGGGYSVQTQQMVTYYEDDKSTAQSTSGSSTWPGWNTNPSSTTQPSTIKLSCVNTDPDSICHEWKIPQGTPGQGLSITYQAVATNSAGATANEAVTYAYPCDPTQHPFGTIAPNVGSSTIDPQCPTPSGKDVYLEADWMTGQRPNPALLEALIDKFATNGITLHIQLDEDIKMHSHQILVDDNSIAGGAGNTDFDTIKKYYFGTSGDRNNIPNPPAGYSWTYQPILTAKKQVFHYALFIHDQTYGGTGSAEILGNDIVVSLGDFAGGIGDVDILEGTLMHELGHNLNLRHGGDEDHNCKPNYLSVMSYSRQGSYFIYPRPLDYSHGTLVDSPNPLNEANLDETQGVGGSSTSGDKVVYGYRDPTSPTGVSITTGNVGSQIDWDSGINATPNEKGIGVNISQIPQIGCTDSPVPDTSIHDFNDWANLNYNMKSNSNWLDGLRIKVNIPGPTNGSVNGGISLSSYHQHVPILLAQYATTPSVTSPTPSQTFPANTTSSNSTGNNSIQPSITAANYLRSVLSSAQLQYYQSLFHAKDPVPYILAGKGDWFVNLAPGENRQWVIDWAKQNGFLHMHPYEAHGPDISAQQVMEAHSLSVLSIRNFIDKNADPLALNQTDDYVYTIDSSLDHVNKLVRAGYLINATNELRDTEAQFLEFKNPPEVMENGYDLFNNVIGSLNEATITIPSDVSLLPQPSLFFSHRNYSLGDIATITLLDPKLFDSNVTNVSVILSSNYNWNGWYHPSATVSLTKTRPGVYEFSINVPAGTIPQPINVTASYESVKTWTLVK